MSAFDKGYQTGFAVGKLEGYSKGLVAGIKLGKSSEKLDQTLRKEHSDGSNCNCNRDSCPCSSSGAYCGCGR